MKPFITLSLIGLFTLLFSFAQETPPAFEKAETTTPSDNVDEEFDPFDPSITAPKFIRVQTEFIELPTKTLTRLLLDDNATTSNATPLRMKAQQLIENDEALMLDTQMIIARSGDKASSESIQEFIYPTEYEPAPPPPNPDDEKHTGKLTNMPHGVVTPIAFETQNLGSILEIEPRLGDDNRMIDLRFLLSLKWHTGNTVWLENKDVLGNISKALMPNFYKLSVDTSMTCLHGQHVLVSVLSPKDAEGKIDTTKKVMVFVKCNIISVIP